MEEIKVKAIIISSTDYKEKNKIINAYSLELGNISAILKNCKSANSKLKFCYSPFCFLELELFKSNDVFIVKTATILDDFFALTQNYDNFLTASAILEIVEKCFKPNETNGILFINLLKCFKMLAYLDANYLLVFAKFLMGATKVLGFRLNFNCCADCSLPFMSSIYLNLDSGELVCEACKGNYNIKISKTLFNVLKTLSNTSVDDIQKVNFTDNDLIDAIKLLTINLENRLNIRFNYKKNLLVP